MLLLLNLLRLLLKRLLLLYLLLNECLGRPNERSRCGNVLRDGLRNLLRNRLRLLDGEERRTVRCLDLLELDGPQAGQRD